MTIEDPKDELDEAVIRAVTEEFHDALDAYQSEEPRIALPLKSGQKVPFRPAYKPLYERASARADELQLVVLRLEASRGAAAVVATGVGGVAGLVVGLVLGWWLL